MWPLGSQAEGWEEAGMLEVLLAICIRAAADLGREASGLRPGWVSRQIVDEE